MPATDTGEDRQQVNGYLFPAGLDVPEEMDAGWFKGGSGDSAFFVAGRDLLVDVAHQAGLESIEVEPAGFGSARQDVAWYAAKATVTIDGETYSDIGSVDQTSNDLEDMASTASTKAIKRAIRRALNIANPGEPPEEPAVQSKSTRTRQGGTISHDPETGEVDVEPPDETGSDESDSGETDDGFDF